MKCKEVLVVDVHNSIENEGLSLKDAVQSFKVNLANRTNVPFVVAVSREKIVGVFYIKDYKRNKSTRRTSLVTMPVPFIFRILIGLSIDVKRKPHDQSAVRYKAVPGIKSLVLGIVEFCRVHWKILLGILAALMLIFILSCLPKSCKLKSENNFLESTKKIEEGVVHADFSETFFFPEMKFPEFEADSDEYRSDSKMQERCDFIAEKLLEILKEQENLKFVIKGYVADFANEIDDEKLALGRASKIKGELVRRGVPEKVLLTVSGGKTNRWGNTNDSNRICTIEFCAK